MNHRVALDLYVALRAIEQKCSLITCHTYYNVGHPLLRSFTLEPLTFTPVAQRWAVELSLPQLFSMPHLLWHGASVYNGRLRGPMTLSPIAERSAVELLLFLRLRSVGTRDPPRSPAHKAIALPLHHQGGSFFNNMLSSFACSYYLYENDVGGSVKCQDFFLFCFS